MVAGCRRGKELSEEKTGGIESEGGGGGGGGGMQGDVASWNRSCNGTRRGDRASRLIKRRTFHYDVDLLGEYSPSMLLPA